MFWETYRSRWSRFCIGTALALGGVLVSLPGQSQTAPIFERVTLRPKFSPDPMTIRGISGGDVDAKIITGRESTDTGPCSGFLDREPDHILTLTSFFNYLSLQVQSSEDTTLVIMGPGGTWCNDDYQGKNPGIAGQWLAGKYRVWVGSYAQKKYIPYVIKLTEVQ